MFRSTFLAFIILVVACVYGSQAKNNNQVQKDLQEIDELEKQINNLLYSSATRRLATSPIGIDTAVKDLIQILELEKAMNAQVSSVQRRLQDDNAQVEDLENAIVDLSKLVKLEKELEAQVSGNKRRLALNDNNIDVALADLFKLVEAEKKLEADMKDTKRNLRASTTHRRQLRQMFFNSPIFGFVKNALGNVLLGILPHVGNLIKSFMS